MWGRVVSIYVVIAVTGACGGSPPEQVTGLNAAVRADTAGVVCPNRSDAIIWSGSEGVRLLAIHAGNDHRDELLDAATQWSDNTGIRVHTAGVALYGSPVPSRLVRRLGGEPSPDIAEGFVGGVTLSCAIEERLADLTDLWHEHDWDAVIPTAVRDLATVDGRRYAVPTTVQWNPIWYRPDIFAQLDLEPPTTWEELLSACDVLFGAGIQPISLGVSTWTPPVARWFSHINLGLNGADFHEGLLAGRESWADERVMAVFDHWRQLLDRGCFGDDPGKGQYFDAIDAVVEGEAGMLDLGSWIHESLEPEQSAMLAPFPFPTIDPEVERTEIATVQGLVIPAAAEDPERARELLAALASPARVVQAHAELGRVPVRDDVDVELTANQRAERDAIAGADRLVQLLEFSAEAGYASAMLGALTTFIRSPETLQERLDALESMRVDLFGEAAP